MRWTWATPRPVSDPDLAQLITTGWPTQDAAEAGLKEIYQDLADEGINQVTLTDRGTPVYSMSLDPE